MDNDDIKTQDDTTNKLPDDVVELIRQGKKELEGMFDEDVTYKDIIEKDILDLMGFFDKDPERRSRLHEKLARMLENRIAVRLIDLLGNKVNEYDALITAGKNQEAGDFLVKNNIAINDILLSETIILKVELYLDSKEIKKQSARALEEKFDKVELEKKD